MPDARVPLPGPTAPAPTFPFLGPDPLGRGEPTLFYGEGLYVWLRHLPGYGACVADVRRGAVPRPPRGATRRACSPADVAPTGAALPWTPDDPLRPDATDDQSAQRWRVFYFGMRAAHSHPEREALAIAATATARELAAARWPRRRDPRTPPGPSGPPVAPYAVGTPSSSD